jgi:hypothetical protein
MQPASTWIVTLRFSACQPRLLGASTRGRPDRLSVLIRSCVPKLTTAREDAQDSFGYNSARLRKDTTMHPKRFDILTALRDTGYELAARA